MRVGNETKNEVEFHDYRMTGSVAPTKLKVDMTMPESLKNANPPAGDKAAPAPANATVTTVKEAWINAFATATVVGGVEIGGLSGISYNPYTDRFIAISDVIRAATGPVGCGRLIWPTPAAPSPRRRHCHPSG